MWSWEPSAVQIHICILKYPISQLCCFICYAYYMSSWHLPFFFKFWKEGLGSLFWGHLPCVCEGPTEKINKVNKLPTLAFRLSMQTVKSFPFIHCMKARVQLMKTEKPERPDPSGVQRTTFTRASRKKMQLCGKLVTSPWAKTIWRETETPPQKKKEKKRCIFVQF